MKKLLALLFTTGLLVAALFVSVPGASARNGGASCDAFYYVASAYTAFETPAYYHQSGNSELWYCD